MAAATTSDIRAWAQANGFDVGDRGRLPVEVTEAFHKSNAKAGAAKAAPAKKATPASTATPAKKATPVRKPAAVAPAKAPATVEAKAPVAAAPAIVVEADAPPAPALEERVAALEKQLALLKGKVDSLTAAPAKRGFGRRR